MAGKVEDLVDTTTSAGEAVNTTFEGVNGFFARIGEAVKSFIGVVKSVGGAFWKMVVGGLMIALRAAGGVLEVIQNFIRGIIGKIVPDVVDAFETDAPEYQDGGLAAQVASFVCCVILPYKMFAQSSRTNFLAALTRNLGGFSRVTDGFEGAFSTVLRLIQGALNFALKFVSNKQVTLVGAAQAAVMKWSREVDAKMAQIDCKEPNVAVLTEAKALLGVGYNLKSTLQAAHLKIAIERQLDKLNVKIAPFRGLLETENCYRAPPLFVMFGGESAVGKTYLIKAFASAVLQLAKLCPPDEVAQNMWQKGEDRFFNGYCGQLVYIMDDVFQKKAVKGSDECEGMTIIKAVNSWPFPLPFADVESKGRFFFSSKLMIGTTNQVNIRSDLDQVLAKPEAVLRRISHGYWMDVAPEYRTAYGTFDYGKFERVQAARIEALKDKEYTDDEVLSCIPWEAWTLRPCAFDGSPLQGQGPSVFSLIKDVAAELKLRASRHTDNVAALNKWLNMFPGAIQHESGLESDCEVIYDADSYPLNDINYDEEELRAEHDTPVRMMVADPLEKRASVQDDKYAGRAARIDAKYETSFWKKAFHEAAEGDRRARRDVTYGFRLFFREIKRGFKDTYTKARNGNIICSATMVAYIVLAIRTLKAVWSVATAAAKAIRNLIFGAPDDDAEHQSVHQEKVFPAKKQPTEVMPSARAEMGNPPEDGAADRVYKNTWKLMCGDETVGQVLMLRGKIGVMPFHFRKGLSSADTIEMIACSAHTGGLRVKMTGAKFSSFEHKDYPALDLTFVDFSPVCAQAHRDVVKYCITDRDVVKDLMHYNNNFGVRLDIARPVRYNDRVQLERIAYVAQGLRYDPKVTVGYADTEQLWTYNMSTQCGDCGAPLTIAEPRYFGGKSILGIHIAGRSRSPANGGQRQGWAAILTKELVEKALSTFKNRASVIYDKFDEDVTRRGITVLHTDEIIEECGLANGSMAPIGTVGDDCAVSQSVRSKIKETGFDGFGPSPVAPAILHPVVRDGSIVQPMHKAMENYSTPLHISNLRNPNAIMGLAMQRHWELTATSTRKILSDEEAVVGVSHMKLKSIKRSSSCGYPYNLKYAKGKTDIFGDGDEFDLTREGAQEVLAEVAGIVEDAKQGVRRAHIFVDFLKDETRPLAKVEAVATRAISGAPVDYSIAVRKYFGAFMSSVHCNHTMCGMAPGINHYTEWDVLANQLLRHGERVFAGDFKAFDASEQPDIHAQCLRYINSWYRAGGGTSEDDLVREVLFQDLVHSRHLTGVGAMRDSLVQWNKSLPSGHPLTTIINSMYSLFAITACYVKRTGDYTSMWDAVYICTYGDDNVVGVSDAVSEVFNQVTVAEDMKDMGLTYTSDKKDGVVQPYETIDDITFLKRSFARAEVEGGWCGPLNMDSILYRTYYYHNNRSFKKDLEMNFHDAMLELSLHGEEEWPERYAAALNYCRELGLSFSIQSREQARELCFARTDVWY
jgi:hypothetical protein